MRSLRWSLLACAVCAASTLHAALGPTGTLYIVAYNEFGANSGLNLVQGNTKISFNTGNAVDICIAAYGDIRTMGYTQADQGSRFNLAGSPLVGGPYVNTISNSQLHDGTTDGTFNFSVDYTTGNVLRFDRNWASPSVLFNATGTLPGAGWITLDPSDGSFWLSQWGGPDRVEHRTAAGALISSFNSGIVASSGLAFDPLDGTLWMSDGATTLYQFSQSGTMLQAPTYAFGGQLYGMEFETRPVPEPASLAALGFGVVAFLRRRRR